MHLVGKDVSVYSVATFGFDANGPENANAGVAYSLIGRWKTFEARLKKNWVDRTSSDAGEVEKRKTTEEWTGSLKGIVNQTESAALALFLSTDYIMITWVDRVANKTFRLRGGISESNYSADQGAIDDGIECESVGRLGGGAGFPSFEVF